MKNIVLSVISMSIFLTSHGQKFKNHIDTFSYSLGVNIASNLKSKGINELNSKILIVKMMFRYLLEKRFL